MTMSMVASRANADPMLAGRPMRADVAETLGSAAPALSALAAFGLGVAIAAGVAAAYEAGYEVGHGGDPRPGAN